MIARSREKAYKFSQIYSEQTTEQIFRQSVQEEVDNTLQGLNSCVFAFGATGAGKTYTMFGGSKNQQTEVGVIEHSMRVKRHHIVPFREDKG